MKSSLNRTCVANRGRRVVRIVHHVLVALAMTGCATVATSSNQRGNPSDETVAEPKPASAADVKAPDNPAPPATPLLESAEFERISNGVREANALSALLSQWALLLLGG